MCISACKKKYAKKMGIVLFLGLVCCCPKGSIRQGVGSRIRESARAPLYRYLASLPKTTLIAATPILSDCIKTFSQRKVFITCEQAQHWFKGYAGLVDRRAIDFFKMYYSDSGREVYDICKANGIEYLVINLDDFSPKFISMGKFTDEPLNRNIVRIVSEKKTFFLFSLEERKILYRLDNDLVVKADESTLLK